MNSHYPSSLDHLIDYAHRSQLLKYDDGRLWYYLTDPDVGLGELASAALVGKIEMIRNLVEKGTLIIRRSLRDIPGDDFYCVYFEDAYFLKLYVAH